MEVISKQMFIELLKFKPHSLIGSQIIYDNRPQIIHDVSLSGDRIFLEKGVLGNGWFPADSVGEEVVIEKDVRQAARNAKLFTVAAVTKDIESILNRIGQPESETSKSLFEIVTALNKEVLELRLKIEEMELKEKNYEYKEEKP